MKIFKNTKESTGLIYKEPNDPRDVYTSQYVQFGSSSLNKNYYGYPKEKWKDIIVEDQRATPSCVGQTFGKEKELREGKDVSKRYIYVLTDKFYENKNRGGLNPVNAARMLVDIGSVLEKYCEDKNFVRFEDYYNVNKLTAVEHHQNTGWAYVPRYDIEALKAAFKKHTTLPLAVYKGKFNRKTGELTEKGSANHAILALGIEKMKDDKHKVHFVNSWGDDWGDDGFGWFIHEDVVEAGLNFFFMAVSNVPKKVIQENKDRYKLIKIGSIGESVKIAQRILGITDDGIFGPITRSHVRMFQVKNLLYPDGIVGPKTWNALLNK